MKRTCRQGWVLAGMILWAGLAAAQTPAPVAPNPFDPVTASMQLLATPAARAAALGLLSQAGQNYLFGQQGAPDMTLSVSLQSSGGLRLEGTGTMTEIWAGGRRTWQADFDGASSGIPYGLTSNPVPLRIAQTRTALLWPLLPLPAREEILAANATVQGAPATCVLVNHSRRPPPARGRDWHEAEYCMNASGQLLLDSPAPGYYFLYDYAQPVQYAGHMLASSIRIIEGQQTVVRIQITRFGPPSQDDLEMLQQSPRRRGILTVHNEEVRFHPPQPPPEGEAGILLFTVGPAGNVLASEIVPNGDPDFEQQVLTLLGRRRFRPRRVEQLILLRATWPRPN
ncbi:MAG: hypothetical protein ACRD04_05515 [Terriglobales bacterium]